MPTGTATRFYRKIGSSANREGRGVEAVREGKFEDK
jgi:hypothetical protein